MTKYEIMFIVKALSDGEAVKKIAENYQKLIETINGKVLDFKEMGEKKLAYPIKKEVSGYYYVMQVELAKDEVAEFNRKIRLDENVLRHLVIRLDEE